MKILFYDIRKIEFEYLTQNMPSSLEPYFINYPLNETTYIDEKMIDCEALSVFVSSTLNKDVLEKFKNLKYIFLRSAGYSNVDLAYCKNNNILIFNAPQYGPSSVAEYAFSLILNLSKRIDESKNALLSGEIDANNLIGIELKNKIIGIIGLGSIGRKILNIAHGFNMEVLAYDIEQKGAYNYVELDELLEKSDFITINCPLTPQTKHLINKDSFSKMKKSAILVNVARGEIVDTKELYLALINKKIKGAALDVIECEEILCNSYLKCEKYKNIKISCLKKYLFIQKLLKLPNVIITPHNAYNTYEANVRILKTTLFNIKQILNNELNSGVKNLVLL